MGVNKGIRGAASLINGFNMGWDAVGKIGRDIETAKVAGEKPTTDTGYTAAQGEELRAAADSGQYDVAYDQEKGHYTVRPKASPEMVGEIAPQQRTQFLGKTYDKPLDDEAVSRERRLAMAGVAERWGDVAGGGRMRDDIRRADFETERLAAERTRGQREAQLFEWQKADRGHADEMAKLQRDYQEGRQSTFNNTVFGQRNATYAKAVEKYRSDKAAYDAAIEAGDRSASEPMQPTRPNLTIGESLLDHATMLAHEMKYGKADSASLMQFAQLQKQVTDEQYVQSLRLAQQGAPLTQVVAAFNSGGKVKIDPAAIVSDKTVDRGQGVKARLITFKNPDGTTQTIDTVAELDSLDKADKIFQRGRDGKADERADRADKRAGASAGRAASEFEAGAGGRQVAQQTAALQLERLKPETTPERRAQIDELLAGGRKADTNEPADVKLAKYAMSVGMFADPKEALTWAARNKDASPEKVRADLYAKALVASGTAAGAKKATDEGMAYLFPDGGAAKAGPKPGMSFENDAAAAAAAKAGKIKPGDRVSVGGVSGTWK